MLGTDAFDMLTDKRLTNTDKENSEKVQKLGSLGRSPLVMAIRRLNS